MAHNSTLTITIAGDEKAIACAAKYIGDYSRPVSSIELLRQYLEKVNAGSAPSKVYVFMDKGDGTAATGTVACTQASAIAGDTFTLCGVTFTVATSPSSDPALGQFAAGASDTDMGDNLAAAINAHPALKGMLTAENSSGTVTWTLTDKGVFGNQARATETGDSMVVTNPTNGAIGTIQTSLKVYRRGK